MKSYGFISQTNVSTAPAFAAVASEVITSPERTRLLNVRKQPDQAGSQPSAPTKARSNGQSFAERFILEWKTLRSMNGDLRNASKSLTEASTSVSQGKLDELSTKLSVVSGVLDELIDAIDPTRTEHTEEAEKPRAMAMTARLRP